MFKVAGHIWEDEYDVVRYRRYLPADERLNRKLPLIQFWAREGGLRTVDSSSLVDIS